MSTWKIYEKTGQSGMRLVGEFETKRQCAVQLKAVAVGTIFRIGRDYIITTRS